ncbi:MAG: S8 family serine peptidase, partial [Anaerolineales bacterium]|nr:S8 family serine peptidase [Anaerolineales bacterium]
MSFNDSRWSVFWSRGSTRTDPPSATSIYTGKHVGRDPNTTRNNETVGYIVVEAGTGTINGISYAVGVGADIVRGVDNGNGYTYPLSFSNNNFNGRGVASQTAMDGADSSWAYFAGSTPLTSSALTLLVDEDQIDDSERSHTSEQVAYFVFSDDLTLSPDSPPPPTTGTTPPEINLLQNPGFEDGMTGWEPFGTRYNISTVAPHSGNNALAIYKYRSTGVKQVVPATPGAIYVVSGWAKFNASYYAGANIQISFLLSSGYKTTPVLSNAWGYDQADDGYRAFELGQATAPPDATAVEIQFVMNSNASGSGYVYIDDMRLLELETNDFLEAIGADQAQDQGVDGTGVGIAVLDTGVEDIALGDAETVLARYDAIGSASAQDPHGHGSFVASVAGGRNQNWVNGTTSVAPGANIIDVRVLDEDGSGTYSQVVDGLNWVLAHKDQYNIRVVNLSLSGPVTGPYWENPVNQAVEALWDAGIVVVAAAGNTGPTAGSITTPGNDPFVITVGAFTDNYSPSDSSDDFIPPFSAAGPTEAGFIKPDVIAPGAHVMGYVNGNSNFSKAHLYFERGESLTAAWYFQGSGTSVSTAVTSGVVALMLDQNPALTPNQVKHRLMITARPALQADGKTLAYSLFQQGAGQIRANDAVFGNFPGEANVGMVAGQAYVGPVIYDNSLDVYRLVDRNRNPLPQEANYMWDGGNFWNGG